MFRTHHNILQIVNDEYVVTADNFLKMCIIYLRVQSRVPVVIMGETGCGKTSLIKFFSQNILNDKLIIFNIHAGITAKMILEKVYECI
jgi:ABC-type lipoprotein export system ATPase subunit